MATANSANNEVMIPGQPNNLANLVNYQAGSIVSKTLMEQPSGTVTLFAFGQGQSLSEHTAPFDALVQILDGESEVTIAGTPFRLIAGDMIIMPANKPHALKAPTQFKMLLIMLKS